MKIIKYQKLKNNKYKLFLDNDKEITLYDSIILNNNLLITKEIDDIDRIVKDNIYYEAYHNALKFIEKKLRTKKELMYHLSLKYDSDVLDYVINEIEKEGYLNDELYVKSYVHDQVLLTNNGYYKILRYLKDNNMDELLIKKYLDEVDNNIWIDKLNKLVSKKVKTNTKYSASKLKEKILHDLDNLGYDKSDILKVISKYNFEDNQDIFEKTFNSTYQKLSKKYSGKELELHVINKLMTKGFSYNDIKNKLK